MKLISFNIRSANDPNGHSFDERAPRMKKIIEKYDPDLIGFQEVVPGWMKHIPEDYSEKYEIFHKYRCEPPDKEEGCTILWKKGQFDLLDQGYFWLSDTPNIVSQGWDCRGYHRIAVWVKLREKKTGVEFHFFNTHYGFSDECQMKSAKLILDHFKPLGVRTFFITGDFNMFSHSPAYKYMTGYLQDVNALLDNDTSNTYHGYNPDFKGHPGPIDFCFITPKTVLPLGCKKITDTFDGKYPSDHYGLELDLNVRQALDLLCLDAKNLYPEDEKKAAHQRSQLRRKILWENQELIALRGAEERLKEKILQMGYAAAFGESASPLFYKEALFELQEEILIAEKTGLAVLKHKNTGKVFGVINADDAVAEKIAALLKERKDLPMVCTANMGMQIGDEAYRALREEMADFRYILNPQNTAPTYTGNYADMADPAIRDFAFFKGEAIQPLAYELSKMADRKGFAYSAHEGMMVRFTI